MMREIKFRAFSKHDKKYVRQAQTGLMFYQKVIEDEDEVPELWFVMEEDEDFRYRFEEVMLDDDWIKMQYTGLHDKNGKEIYEGDIVKMLSRNLSQVYFRDSGFCVDVGGILTGVHPDYLGRYRTVEVVGNIYENPELLEARKTTNELPCPICHGAGVVMDSDDPCTECGGSGRIG